MEEQEPSLEQKPDAAEGYAQVPAWFQADVPEFYADTVNVNVGPYGMSVTFGIRGFLGPVPKARVFMSHEMALVMSRLLRRIIRSYELDNGVAVQVPEPILAELKLRIEDLEALEAAVTPDDDRDHGEKVARVE
jgi:hypothetical protein